MKPILSIVCEFPELFCGAAPDWRAAGTAEIEITKTQTSLFRGVDWASIGNGGVWRYSECVALVAFISNFAGSQFGIGFLPACTTLPSTATTNSLRACPLGVGFGLRLFVKTTWTIPVGRAIEEQQIAEVAPARYPTENGAGCLRRMREALHNNVCARQNYREVQPV